MSSGLRAAAQADLGGLQRRHPAVFRPSPQGRLIAAGTVFGLIGLFAFGLVHLEFSITRIWSGFGQLGNMVSLMMPPSPGTWAKALIYLRSLAETVAIAFLGTLLAAIVALPLGLLAARNATINRVVQFMSRRFLDSIRGVDTLIWALIWVNVVGLGPFAGVLAIMTADIGAFGKLFSEAIEAADKKAVEGVTSSGGSKLHIIRFGLLPQVMPVMIGQVLYYMESNTRSATIIGIVGAGGIGLYLAEMIRTLEWQTVSFLVILILVAVAIIDQISTRLRFAIIGNSQVTTG